MSVCLPISGYSFIFLILFISLGGISACGGKRPKHKTSKKIDQELYFANLKQEEARNISNNQDHQKNNTSNSRSHQSYNPLNKLDDQLDNRKKPPGNFLTNITEKDINKIIKGIACPEELVCLIKEKLKKNPNYQLMTQKDLKDLINNIKMDLPSIYCSEVCVEAEKKKQKKEKESKEKSSLAKKLKNLLSALAKPFLPKKEKEKMKKKIKE